MKILLESLFVCMSKEIHNQLANQYLMVSFIGFMFKNHSHQGGEVDQGEWLSIPCNYETDCTYESIGDTREENLVLQKF